MRALSATLSAFVILSIASACGGGGDSRLDTALESVTEEQLAVMVLPQDAYGDLADDLETDSDSGSRSSEDAADDTVDPDDSGTDLEDAGFKSGYDLTYIDKTFASLEEGGVFTASSTVDLFTGKASASAQMTKEIEDYREFEGSEVEPGL